MSNIDYIIALFERKFGLLTEKQDYSCESVSLEKQELDEDLLPEYFDELDTDIELLMHLYDVAEYTVYILADVEDSKWYLLGIIKQDKLIYYQLFDN